jgi:cytoskeletal protein CcmA (bactofilin family)
MFSKSNKKTLANAKPLDPSAPPSIISRDLKIVGDLLSEGEIQIDGRVNGDIRTKVLTVGETAHVKGEIVAETVRVLGHVDGQIKAKSVKLALTAHVVGDILHEDLSIETGAFLEGNCKRTAIPEEIFKSDKNKGQGSLNEPHSHQKADPHGKPASVATK